MKLYIPAQGDELELLEDWNFTLARSYNNRILLDKFERDIDVAWYLRPPLDIMLDKGTVLIVDRIYVRRNGKDPYEVSLRVKHCPNPVVGKARLHVSLDQANSIEFRKV